MPHYHATNTTEVEALVPPKLPRAASGWPWRDTGDTRNSQHPNIHGVASVSRPCQHELHGVTSGFAVYSTDGQLYPCRIDANSGGEQTDYPKDQVKVTYGGYDNSEAVSCVETLFHDSDIKRSSAQERSKGPQKAIQDPV